MENLSIHDPLLGSQADSPMSQEAPHHHPAPPAPPLMLHQPPVPQLPPQMFTTAAQLLDLTDKKLMVALRDGRKFFGVLRSWDQFANLVLQSTVERIFVPFPPSKPASSPGAEAGSDAATPHPLGLFADYPRGLYLIRGENVLLLGEIDLDKDDDVPVGYVRGDPDVVTRMDIEHKAAVKVREAARLRCLAKFGFEGEYVGDVLI